MSMDLFDGDSGWSGLEELLHRDHPLGFAIETKPDALKVADKILFRLNSLYEEDDDDDDEMPADDSNARIQRQLQSDELFRHLKEKLIGANHVKKQGDSDEKKETDASTSTEEISKNENSPAHSSFAIPGPSSQPVESSLDLPSQLTESFHLPVEPDSSSSWLNSSDLSTESFLPETCYDPEDSSCQATSAELLVPSLLPELIDECTFSELPVPSLLPDLADESTSSELPILLPEVDEKPIEPLVASLPLRKHPCSLCHKKFMSSNKLLNHYRMIHCKPEKSASEGQCQHCGKVLTTPYGLILHVRYVHEGVRPFACLTCDKQFVTQTDLRVHTRIHTGEKPYTCGQCGKTFSDKSNLRHHTKIHSNVCPFICSKCGKGFKFKCSLESHEKAHM